MCEQCKILTQQLKREQACSEIGRQQRDRTIYVLLDIVIALVKEHDGDIKLDEEYYDMVAQYVSREVGAA